MANQTLAKYINELHILTTLRTQGAASRAEIARRLLVTPATITRLVSDLAKRELVREVHGPVQKVGTREPGRPGTNIALNPDGAFFLGIEIGVGILRYALLDLSASVVLSSETLVSRKITPVEAVKAITDHLAKLERSTRFRSKIRSAGVTVPGLVTSEGFIVHLPVLGWKNTNLLDMLNNATNLPCRVENNANAAAFGSVYTQPSLPSVCTIFLKLGTGCGGAAIINGRLLRGATGMAGELGHIRMTEHGHRCSCGQVGCLESWVNLAALARSFRGTDRLSTTKYAALPAAVIAAAEAGNPAALAAIASFSHFLSLGIISLVNIFNPTTIMLGGMMRPIAERCLGAIRARVASGVIPGMRIPEVRLSMFENYECAVGASTIAHHDAFDISKVDLSSRELLPLIDPTE
jgi:predicted NBD/HSP70 family sugar kinase